MSPASHTEYGRCPCGGEYELRFVEVRMTVDDMPIVLTDIPQGACRECGSRVYKAVALEGIEALMAKRSMPRPRPDR